MWKKHFRLDADKEKARALAVQRFPNVKLHLKKEPGCAEALLMALSGEGDQDMNIHEGAVLREMLVERTVDSLIPPGGNGFIRFHLFGAVRCGVFAAAQEMAQAYPQLAERIYERFGMSGWTLRETEL